MSIFQNTVVTKYLHSQNKESIATKWELYKTYFHNLEIQENIRNSKEEQFQEGFLRELFVKVLGYTLNPEPNFNLTTELKKKKVKLSLSQKAEWEDYFLAEQQKAVALKTQINQTDKAIDHMVYKLYGLIEEEIKIVENS